MPSDGFDLIVIGSGPAGEKGAAQAAYFEANLGRHRIELVPGYAEFEDPHTLRVTDMDGGVRRLSAPVILIATGSYPNWPDGVTRDPERLYDSDSIGLIKLVFSSDDRRLLGVHILGEMASELVHVGQGCLHFGGTLDYFIQAVFNYPTLGEAYKYAAYDGLGNLARQKKLQAP